MRVIAEQDTREQKQQPAVQAFGGAADSPVKIDSQDFEQTIFVESDYDKTRISLPSRGLFYDKHKTIKVRGLTVGEGEQLKKFEYSKNLSIVIDVVQGCIQGDVDVRELTQGDFLFILIYIIICSCPDVRYSIKWTSFYGNENLYTLIPSQLASKEVDYKKLLQEVPDFKELRFTPGRVKHLEILLANKHTPEDSDSWTEQEETTYKTILQYLDEDSLEKQILRAKSMPMNSKEFRKLKKFIALQDHYVDPIILGLKDAFFNLEEALEYLKANREELKESAKNSPEAYAYYASVHNHANLEEVEEEIGRLENAKATNTPIGPREEEISIPLDIPSLIEPLYYFE